MYVCIGTALVDNTVRDLPYPNRIIALTDLVIVKWDRDTLAALMYEDQHIESAVLNALYVGIIQGLRREKQTNTHDPYSHLNVLHIKDKIRTYELMVVNAIKQGTPDSPIPPNLEEIEINLRPKDKRKIREFVLYNRITSPQREGVLNKYGWSLHEWEDGAKDTTQTLAKSHGMGSENNTLTSVGLGSASPLL